MHPVAGATLKKPDSDLSKGKNREGIGPLPRRVLLPLFFKGRERDAMQQPLFIMAPMNKTNRNKNNGNRYYSTRPITPLNRQQATSDFDEGRIHVRIWPTGSGPIYRFRTDFRFMYPNGQTTEYIPDNALRELERAVWLARKKIRRLERIQFQPVWVRIIRFALGI